MLLGLLVFYIGVGLSGLCGRTAPFVLTDAPEPWTPQVIAVALWITSPVWVWVYLLIQINRAVPKSVSWLGRRL